MKRRVTSLLICMMLALGLCACSKQEVVSSDVNQTAHAELDSAIKKLENWQTPYVISSTLEAPDGIMRFIECTNNGDSYTEYSVDSNGNYGTLDYASSDTVSYAMTDWCTSEGDYYLFTIDETGADVIYQMPKSYSSLVKGRETMYARQMLNSLISLEKQDSMRIDIGFGEQDYAIYRGIIPSSVVKDILGVGSYGVYKSIYDDSATSENVKALCGHYLADLDMNLTFSDGIVLFGVDANGVLQYTILEVGGLGTRMYLTKAVVEQNNTANLRQRPDFSVTKTYASSMEDFAGYVASFDSYEEALVSLENSYIGTEDVVTDLEEELESETSDDGSENVEDIEVSVTPEPTIQNAPIE